MFARLLIANRGEIAIRMGRAARELGVATRGVFTTDDATSLYVRRLDEPRALNGTGVYAFGRGPNIDTW